MQKFLTSRMEEIDKLTRDWADSYAHILNLQDGEKIAHRAGALQMYRFNRQEALELREQILNLEAHILTYQDEILVNREMNKIFSESEKNRKHYRLIPKFKRKFSFWCGYHVGASAVWALVAPFLRSYKNKIFY